MFNINFTDVCVLLLSVRSWGGYNLSGKMKRSFILLGCSCWKRLQDKCQCIFLQQLRLIFIIAKPPNWSADVVECRGVLINFNWLKLRHTHVKLLELWAWAGEAHTGLEIVCDRKPSEDQFFSLGHLLDHTAATSLPTSCTLLETLHHGAYRTSKTHYLCEHIWHLTVSFTAAALVWQEMHEKICQGILPAVLWLCER